MRDNTHGLNGKVALVTGASRGLGAHLARLLADAGMTTILCGRDLEALKKVAQEIVTLGGKAEPLFLDLADSASIAESVTKATDIAGAGIDVLINNAGIATKAAAVDTDYESVDRLFRVNSVGTYALSTLIAKQMINAGRRGSIINIASTAALYTVPRLAAYGASKASVVHLTRLLAAEWADRFINVNCLCPGVLLNEQLKQWLGTPQSKGFEDRFPRRRVPEPSSLDALVLLLASPASSAITGAVIEIDDGLRFSPGQ